MCKGGLYSNIFLFKYWYSTFNYNIDYRGYLYSLSVFVVSGKINSCLPLYCSAADSQQLTVVVKQLVSCCQVDYSSEELNNLLVDHCIAVLWLNYWFVFLCNGDSSIIQYWIFLNIVQFYVIFFNPVTYRRRVYALSITIVMLPPGRGPTPG